MKALRVLPLLLVLAGCDAGRDDPLERLSLTADRTVYAAGSEVQLTLRNESAVEVQSTGLACARLERRSDAGWALSPEGNARGCGAVVTVIPAGGSWTVPVPLDGVGWGTYRYAQRAGLPDAYGGVTLTTPPFEVR